MGIACEQAPKRSGAKKKSEQSVAAVFPSIGYARLASLADFLFRLAPVSGDESQPEVDLLSTIQKVLGQIVSFRVKTLYSELQGILKGK